jgi:multidrug resistance protein
MSTSKIQSDDAKNSGDAEKMEEISQISEQSLHHDDPLGWSLWRKYYIVILMSSFTTVAQLAPAMLNPAFVIVAKELNVTVEEASYSTTIFILFAGVFPLFITPFANVYGRRPLYLIFTVLSIAGFIVSAASPSWGGLIAGRVLSAIGCSIPLGLGAATICDLFTQGQRGLPMGIFAWATTNGPHIAPIAGGYIAQRYGWRWCNWVSAIIEGVLFLLALFTFPETLFSAQRAEKVKQSTLPRLLYFGKVHERRIRVADFFVPLKMLKYAAITIPCIMYMVNLTYGSPLYAVTGSFICAGVFHFNLGQTGLFLGLPLTVGCILGELSAGWVSDWIINMYASRHQGYRKAEVRLYLLPLVLLTSVGLATFGWCIDNREPWIRAAVCMAVSGFGTQIATTVTYTYCCDSYRAHSSDVSVTINLLKSRELFPPCSPATNRRVLTNKCLRSTLAFTHYQWQRRWDSQKHLVFCLRLASQRSFPFSF